MAKTKTQRSLDTWTEQEWTTPSGKKSGETGEVYAPKKTTEALRSSAVGKRKLAAANKKKREATAEGRQHADHGLHSKKKKA